MGLLGLAERQTEPVLGQMGLPMVVALDQIEELGQTEELDQTEELCQRGRGLLGMRT